MDSSISSLYFDESGQCQCCKQAIERLKFEWWPDEDGKMRLEKMSRELKSFGRGSEYDCMIGLSGGIDSAFLADLAVKKLGLRVLAVHVDAGWNSAAAVKNIESIVRKLDIDLHTYVVEWGEMKDIQLAYLKSSVLNQDAPQDHAFFSTLYKTAIEKKIKNFLSGVNYSSENIIPPNWGHPYMDSLQIKAIHKKFGLNDIQTFPFMSMTEFIWQSRIIKRLKVYRPLNFINYDKTLAKRMLEENYGWVDYGGKHHESRFTKFYQEIYLPRKFGFDKRRLHLSSLIVSGQISREEALIELNQPSIGEGEINRDIRFVAKKLGIGVNELSRMIESRPVSHSAYPNQLWLHRKLIAIKKVFGFGTGTV